MSEFIVTTDTAGDRERIQEFVDRLATTDVPQAKSLLADVIAFDQHEPVWGYCCLGFGAKECAAVPIEIVGDDEGDLLAYFGADDVRELAPWEFIEWLGLYSEGRGEWDVHLNLPAGMTTTGGTVNALSLAGMNDAGFTFRQIAQMIAYFGLVDNDE